MTPHRIALIAHGRYDELIAGADIYPGHIGALNSSGNLIPHNVAGGPGPLRVVLEDALQGKTINDKIDSGSMCPHYAGQKGDVYLFRIAAGQNIAVGDKLKSNGDGALSISLGQYLANVVADSSNITNTTVETTFSNGTYTIPANTLKAGDIIRVRGVAVVTAQNSTNTHQIKVYLGTTAVADTVAAALAALDTAFFDVTIEIRTAGASGTFVAHARTVTSISGAGTTKTTSVASTAIDTTVTNAITVKSTASAASTGNVVKLSQFTVSDERSTGLNQLVEAQEAVDNSAGLTEAFIRGMVL